MSGLRTSSRHLPFLRRLLAQDGGLLAMLQVTVQHRTNEAVAEQRPLLLQVRLIQGPHPPPAA